MDFSLLSPREQIVTLMGRIYRRGLTTTSGGNLSLREPGGDVWITPAGVDKGRLAPTDIIRVDADHRAHGPHRPSSEYPFHRAIYDRRPDLGAIVHAHPPGLVAFSLAHRRPDTRLLPRVRALCGEVGYAPYRMPGSRELGEVLADAFAQGFDAVILENHGVAVGGPDLLTAFHRFEALEFLARALIRAHGVGSPLPPPAGALPTGGDWPTFAAAHPSARERELRRALVEMVHRAHARGLIAGRGGVFSARVDGGSFLITPHGVDRAGLGVGDVVGIRDGRREAGRPRPDIGARRHLAVYRAHPDVRAIIEAAPPSLAAFALADVPFDTRTIPESYLVLRRVALLPFGATGEVVADHLGEGRVAVLIRHEGLLVTGRTLAQAFDRLEVAAFTARATMDSLALGGLVPIGREAIAEIEARWFGG